jgi:hypothetical protein
MLLWVLAITAVNRDEPEFSVNTESLGRIEALPLMIGRMEALDGIEGASSPTVMDSLIVAISRKEDRSEPDKAETSGLTEAEKDAFAAKCLVYNQSPRQAQRFLSAHGFIASLFCPRRHRMKANAYRTVRDQAFNTGQQVTCAQRPQ